MRDQNTAGFSLLSRLQSFPIPRAEISAIAVALPETEIDNQALSALLTAPDELRKRLPGIIARTTGIHRRRFSAPGQAPSDLGLLAVRKLLRETGTHKNEIDTLIFAGTDQDCLEPATANILQHKLGIRTVNSFDVKNACNGFLQSLNLANSLIISGAARKICICVAELPSHWFCRVLHGKEDLRCKLGGLTLGDGAAAIMVEPSRGCAGITEINLFAQGAHWELCHVPEDPHWRRKIPSSINGWFYLDLSNLARVVRPLSIKYFREYRSFRRRVHGETNFTGRLDKVIPHQISPHLIAEIVKIFREKMEKVAITADYLGNTAAAAIPITLSAQIECGNLGFGSGQEILLFGAASGLGMGHVRMTL
ncbi:MAG TPA: ketoacyl-ACP synthase III [Proteobacteria bacterium]|nr:ketoacyl-ACP synthase III [Pseudomonadota bacterium]